MMSLSASAGAELLQSGNICVGVAYERDRLSALCREEFAEITDCLGEDSIEFLPDEPPVDIGYPVDSYPVKVLSFNLDKNPEVNGILHGIKGQYLILDTGVINIRKFTGYEIEFSGP